MGALFRGKMLSELRRLHQRGELDGFDDFRDPQGFDRLMSRIAKHRWVVYAKKPFRRAHHVLEYLGRYTHRIGIANSRLLDVSEKHVTFRTKHGKSITLDPLEFMRRFVQHVLPPGFVKIRHYGLYAGSHANGQRAIAHQLLGASADLLVARTRTASWQELLLDLTGHDPRCCPLCGEQLARLPLQSRAPPSPFRAA
jgi:hypothetical protein